MVEALSDPRMRVAEVGTDQQEEEQLPPINFEGMEIEELFHSLETTVVGYDEY